MSGVIGSNKKTTSIYVNVSRWLSHSFNIGIWLGEDVTAVPFYRQNESGRNDINNELTESD